MIRLNFYKLHEKVNLPKFGTKNSACFDLCFSSAGKTTISGYSPQNSKIDRDIVNDTIHIMPSERLLIPTGLIMDIPEGYSVRLYPRSGLSLKQGLILANSEGVIDSDYVEEVFMIITNTSSNGVTISDGDRICQGELVKSVEYCVWEINEKPIQKTDRKGGMGSTGVKTSA